MNRATSILLLLLALGGLYGAARLNNPLRAERREYGISQADPLVNAPPLVAFSTVALGGFRGIVADILWIRSARLQEQGRYFELVQLADWITKLEPRFTEIWAYHAWNLSYNISVLLKRDDERWRWVRSGIQLLRDDGLRYNPGDARLLYELGWLFQNKVGGNLDSANMYYKRAWAAEMAQLWNGATPDFDTLLHAANTRAELLARPGVATLVAQLQAAGRDPYSPARIAEAQHAPPDDLLRTPAAHELLAHLRVHLMRETYKLDPAIMRDIDTRYGPLDWRLPQAHAIYWAWQSLAVARIEFDQRAAERMIFQSLADAFRQGRLYTDPARDLFILSPNPDLAPRVLAAYDDALRRFPDDHSIQTAHANFMREAIIVYYSFNRTTESNALFEKLRARYPASAPESDFEHYVRTEFLARQQQLSPPQLLEIVKGALFQSAFWTLHHDADRAAGFQHLAELTWNYLHTQVGGTALPSIETLRQQAEHDARL